MLARRFEPMFPLELAAKDLGYVLAAAEGANAPLPIAGGARDVFERARHRGLQEENLTAVARLYVEE